MVPDGIGTTIVRPITIANGFDRPGGAIGGSRAYTIVFIGRNRFYGEAQVVSRAKRVLVRYRPTGWINVTEHDSVAVKI